MLNELPSYLYCYVKEFTVLIYCHFVTVHVAKNMADRRYAKKHGRPSLCKKMPDRQLDRKLGYIPNPNQANEATREVHIKPNKGPAAGSNGASTSSSSSTGVRPVYHAGLFKLVLTPVSFRGGTKLLRRAREATVTGPGRGEAGPVVLGRHGSGGDIAINGASSALCRPHRLI